MRRNVDEQGSSHVTVTHSRSLLRPPLLGWLDIELTERCDNDCRICCANLPLDDGEARAREMSTSRVKEILDEAAELGLLTVRLSGGEPLVRGDFEEVYLYARRLGVSVSLSTNARGVTPRLARVFAETPPLKPVDVTVYGMSSSTYEAMTRRRGSFDEFRRGVDLLVEASVPMRLKGAFRAPFIEEMESLRAWAASLPTVEGLPRHVMFYSLRRRRDSAAKSMSIAALRTVPDEALAAGALVAGQEAVTAEFCHKFMGPGGAKLFACDIGRRPCVDPYGQIHACTSLRDPRLAHNLTPGSLKHIVTEVFPRLREATASDPLYLQRCARCFLGGLCSQCPGRSYSEHGVLDRPVEYECQVAQAQAQRLGLLHEGELPWEVDEWKERLENV